MSHRHSILIISVTATSAFGTVKTALYVDRLRIDVINVRGRIDCFLRCLQHPDCLSANFWKGRQFHDNICVLNAATRNEYYAMIGTPGDVYYGKGVAEWVYLELENEL